MIRPMSRSELGLLVDWAAVEGWNPGLGDAGMFWETDPDGFVAVEEAGALVAGGSIVSYGGRFGFMGFFIVAPSHRGRGLGRRLWVHRRDALLARLRPGAAIGMDGVFAMQGFYERGGFALAGRDLRMEGVGAPAPLAPRLVDARDLPPAELAAYDAGRFPAPRPGFVARWIAQPGARARAAVDGGAIRGYGVVRPCRRGFKLGPLFAADPAVAEDLFRGLADHAAGAPLFLDVPERNAAARALAARHGMREVFGCARMYLGPPPHLPLHEVYGVTTFELG
jgi:GNAT superfamily N-acetyltransferase